MKRGIQSVHTAGKGPGGGDGIIGVEEAGGRGWCCAWRLRGFWGRRSAFSRREKGNGSEEEEKGEGN